MALRLPDLGDVHVKLKATATAELAKLSTSSSLGGSAAHDTRGLSLRCLSLAMADAFSGRARVITHRSTQISAVVEKSHPRSDGVECPQRHLLLCGHSLAHSNAGHGMPSPPCCSSSQCGITGVGRLQLSPEKNVKSVLHWSVSTAWPATITLGTADDFEKRTHCQGGPAPAALPSSPAHRSGAAAPLLLHAPPARGGLAAGDVIAIGAPNAVALLARSPSEGLQGRVAQPIVLTQHMPPVFTGLLAEQLQRAGGRPCAEGRDGEVIMPGRAYVAPGGWHMVVDRQGGQPVIRLNQEPPENFCRPAVDPLFRSRRAGLWRGVWRSS